MGKQGIPAGNRQVAVQGIYVCWKTVGGAFISYLITLRLCQDELA
jgi:hypothetical protein